MMDTIACSRVEFFDVNDDVFSFRVDSLETDGPMIEDSFKKSLQCSTHFIRNKDNKYLLLSDDSQFEVLNLTIQQQCQPDCKFNIQFYNESGQKVRKGCAVMLYANKNGNKFVVCCSDNHEIYPEAMDPPENIEPTQHKALFYMTKLPQSNKYKLESSLHTHHFLGFEPDKNNPFQVNLVLHHQIDEVDECSEITLL
nr:interleukin 18 [Oostethus manadensis]